MERVVAERRRYIFERYNLLSFLIIFYAVTA